MVLRWHLHQRRFRLLFVLCALLNPDVTRCAVRPFRDNCENHFGRIATGNQQLGCGCTRLGQHCTARYSVCQLVGTRKLCACAPPATRTGRICDLPCSIALSDPARTFIYPDRCQPDGSIICEPQILVSGCQAPFVVKQNYYYSYVSQSSDAATIVVDAAAYRASPLIALREDSPRRYSLILANQQAVMNIQAENLYHGPFADVQCSNFNVTDANGKTSISEPVCIFQYPLYGNDPTSGVNYCKTVYAQTSATFAQCSLGSPFGVPYPTPTICNVFP